MSEQTLAVEFKIPSPSQIDQNETIFLVEDQQDMRLIIAHHLNKLGYKKVQQVGSGHEALEYLANEKNPPSLIICSMELQGLNGIEVLQEVKENPKYQRGPFAMTMTNPNKEKIMLAMESGVDEILVKPFSLKDIMPKLLNAFRKFHNPNNPEKVYELAKRHLREKKLVDAARIYERICDFAQNSARPFVGLARVAKGEGRVDEALNFLGKAEGNNPHYVHLYVVRGEILAKQGKFDEALAEFKKAINISPLNPLRYEAAAQILFDQGRHQDAVDLLNQALNHELSFPSLHHFLSQAHYCLKDYKKAIKHIRIALASEPQNVVYLNQLGISYKESELYEDAAKVYNSIIKSDPENKAALYNKAVLLKATGSTAEAVKILQRLLTKHPDFELAKKKLAEYEKEVKDKKAAS